MPDFYPVTVPAVVGIRRRTGDTALNWRVDKAGWQPSGDLVRIDLDLVIFNQYKPLKISLSKCYFLILYSYKNVILCD